jgi:hypothetical protein
MADALRPSSAASLARGYLVAMSRGTEGGIRACGGMADDDEPVDPVGNEPSPLLFFAAGIIPLLLVGGWFLFR